MDTGEAFAQEKEDTKGSFAGDFSGDVLLTLRSGDLPESGDVSRGRGQWGKLTKAKGNTRVQESATLHRSASRSPHLPIRVCGNAHISFAPSFACEIKAGYGWRTKTAEN